MKKVLLFALMGLVMLGSFTSCKKDKQEKEFKKNIIGKWKTYSHNDTLRLTNEKSVDEFYADGTIKTTFLEQGHWSCSSSGSYKIEGNKYTKMSSNYVMTADIFSITDSYFTYNNMELFSADGTLVMSVPKTIKERVTVDYKQAFIGLWEGVSMTGAETYGAEDHRWLFKDDGTYVYYTKNIAGEWEADPTNTGNIYYVDGNFYGSRWYKDDVEYREWWDIDYCNDTEMRWSALRKKADGSLFTTTMTMKRVVEN